MSGLAAQQRAFLAAVLDNSGPQADGLAIYRRNLVAACHGALAAAYPVVRRLVGQAFFGEAAQRYAFDFPSKSGDLNVFGGDFARFLAAYPHARGLEYLPDVARLEWAVHESHHAADAVTGGFAALVDVPAERAGSVRLALAPVVRLVASVHPILALWDANQPWRDGTLDRDAGPDHVLVSRVGGRVGARLLPPAEWAMLEALARGKSLEAACAAMGEAAGSFGEALARHAAAGVIGGAACAAQS